MCYEKIKNICFSEFSNNEKEMDEIIDVGYVTWVVCHDFVDKNCWLTCKDDMQNKDIPSAETVVAKDKLKIVGFISLVDNVLAAIFVLPDYQG